MSDEINAALLARAAQAFGDYEKARHWLTREQRCFDDMTPSAYAATRSGMAVVLAHLGQIEHGVYS